MNVMLNNFKNTKSVGSVSAHSYINDFSTKKNLIFTLPKDTQVGAGEPGLEYGMT